MYQRPYFDTEDERDEALDRIVYLMERDFGVTPAEYATWPQGKQRRFLRRMVEHDRQQGAAATPPQQGNDKENDPCVMQRSSIGGIDRPGRL